MRIPDPPEWQEVNKAVIAMLDEQILGDNPDRPILIEAKDG
jgi:hypothetical protein